MTTAIGYIIGHFVANGIIMWIWNMIMPDLFGVKPIGYWQMYGLCMICTYLFKPHFKLNNKDK